MLVCGVLPRWVSYWSELAPKSLKESISLSEGVSRDPKQLRNVDEA